MKASSLAMVSLPSLLRMPHVLLTSSSCLRYSSRSAARSLAWTAQVQRQFSLALRGEEAMEALNLVMLESIFSKRLMMLALPFLVKDWCITANIISIYSYHQQQSRLGGCCRRGRRGDGEGQPQRAQQQSNIILSIAMAYCNKSLLNSSLSLTADHNPESRPSFKIFMSDSQGRISHITLHSPGLSVLEVILAAIAAFGQLLHQDLNQNGGDYELFIARRGGSKNEDYPSLEQHQPIHKFAHHRFYLEEKHPHTLKNIHSISTMKSLPPIHTSFRPTRAAQSASKQEEKYYWGCFWRQ